MKGIGQCFFEFAQEPSLTVAATHQIISVLTVVVSIVELGIAKLEAEVSSSNDCERSRGI